MSPISTWLAAWPLPQFNTRIGLFFQDSAADDETRRCKTNNISVSISTSITAVGLGRGLEMGSVHQGNLASVPCPEPMAIVIVGRVADGWRPTVEQTVRGMDLVTSSNFVFIWTSWWWCARSEAHYEYGVPLQLKHPNTTHEPPANNGDGRACRSSLVQDLAADHTANR